MNLQAVITLLQLALALLGTPNLSPSMQVTANDIANQAIVLAQQALAPGAPLILATSTTNYTVVFTPPTTIPNNGGIGTVEIGTVAPPIIVVAPTCSLSGTRTVTNQGSYVTMNWTNSAVASGILYATNDQSSGNPINFEKIGVLNASSGTILNLVDDAYWKAVFDNATCSTIVQ